MYNVYVCITRIVLGIHKHRTHNTRRVRAPLRTQTYTLRYGRVGIVERAGEEEKKSLTTRAREIETSRPPPPPLTPGVTPNPMPVSAGFTPIATPGTRNGRRAVLRTSIITFRYIPPRCPRPDPVPDSQKNAWRSLTTNAPNAAERNRRRSTLG